jgi:hypothetical protein
LIADDGRWGWTKRLLSSYWEWGGYWWALPSSGREHVGLNSLHRYGKRVERQETMRAMSMLRFVLLGAVGFGVGGAIGGFSALVPFPIPLTLTLPVAGAVGGASLGLALKDWRRVVFLAVLGALGLTVGVFAGLILGSFFSYPEAPTGALVGAVVGALLGVAFLDWRTIVALAVSGGVGFGVGLLAGTSLVIGYDRMGAIVVTGIIGGASLGAALGYLENCKLAEGRRPGVR